MSTKYLRLLSHLEGRSENEWSTTFEEIEGIIKSNLPKSARVYSAWWANRPMAQGRFWLTAGWRVTKVDLEAGTVLFCRFADPTGTADGSRYSLAKVRSKTLGSLTIAEAKAGLAMNFGVPVTRIQIIVRL